MHANVDLSFLSDKADEDEDATEEKTGEDSVEKKKRKRKRKQKDKNQQQPTVPPNIEITSDHAMTVLPKLEWKRLRNKYLNLQRKNITHSKMKLRQYYEKQKEEIKTEFKTEIKTEENTEDSKGT